MRITSTATLVIKVDCGIVTQMTAVQLTIATTWDGTALDPAEHTLVQVSASGRALSIVVDAPFAAQPPPSGAPGRTDRLWEHEVVEVFFAMSPERTSRYLELELGPHGHWLALGFSSYRRLHIPDIALSYAAEIQGPRWRGSATIGWLEIARALPEIGAMNAYAIRGGRFMAAWPAPHGQYAGPDFHRLEHFR